jgi:hypothetical protein
MQISWDLHVHPGPSSVPRWGNGSDIQAACKRAGIAGFVWKSHEGHTARACLALPANSPLAIGSVSLNAWATPESVQSALADGAPWVWGPTYDAGTVGWDLPLPAEWKAYGELLSACPGQIVLCTGHLNSAGRRAFAEFAAPLSNITCSITHSLYLGATEIEELNGLGCVFEVDLYTSTRAIPGRPTTNLADGVRALREAGTFVYLTTDCGQKSVGDPYLFSHAMLSALSADLDQSVITEIAIANPRTLAARVIPGSLQ